VGEAPHPQVGHADDHPTLVRKGNKNTTEKKKSCSKVKFTQKRFSPEGIKKMRSAAFSIILISNKICKKKLGPKGGMMG